MTKLKGIAALCLLATLGAVPLVLANAPYSPRAKEIGMHIKCLCKGCDMTACGCAHPGGAFSGPCATAVDQLKEIDAHLGKGESEQQIIDAFIQEYGTIAYVEPPKHGFGLVAWLMPVIYSIVGLAVVIFVVRKWAVRKPAAASVMSAHNETFERARAQAARDTED